MSLGYYKSQQTIYCTHLSIATLSRLSELMFAAYKRQLSGTTQVLRLPELSNTILSNMHPSVLSRPSVSPTDILETIYKEYRSKTSRSCDVEPPASAHCVQATILNVLCTHAKTVPYGVVHRKVMTDKTVPSKAQIAAPVTQMSGRICFGSSHCKWE